MANGYSLADLQDFLAHASDRGLLPAATATALGVASRNIFGVLDAKESQNLSEIDLDAVIKRFTNKRAKDFNPSSLKEYGRRVRKAVELFLRWRNDPANFTTRTRSTTVSRSKESPIRSEPASKNPERASGVASTSPRDAGGYQSSFPIRAGTVVTILNLPPDLTPAEAQRLATFVKMLAVE